jgi:hypothetical protein
MLPNTLTAANSESERRRYTVVRLDKMEIVPGLILAANCETGMCLLRDNRGDSKEHHFGPRGLRIVVVR